MSCKTIKSNAQKMICSIFIAVTASCCFAGQKQVAVYNLGRPGETSSEGMSRFDRVVPKLKPDLLILYYGMNDALFERKMVPAEKYKKNLQTIIDKARRCNVKNIVLITINPIAEGIVSKRKSRHPERDDLSGYLAKFDKKVREVASGKHVILYDLRKLITENGGGEGKLVRNHSNGGYNDGLHLTAKGYKLMAQDIFALIKDKVKAGSVVVCLGDSLTFGSHMKGQGSVEGDSYPAQLNKLLNSAAGK